MTDELSILFLAFNIMELLNNPDSELRVTELTTVELRSLAEKREEELIALRDFSSIEKEIALALSTKSSHTVEISKEQLDALELSRNSAISELDEVQRLLAVSTNETVDLQLQIQLLESALEHSNADRNRMERVLKEQAYDLEKFTQQATVPSPSSRPSSSVPSSSSPMTGATTGGLAGEGGRGGGGRDAEEQKNKRMNENETESALLKTEINDLQLELAKVHRVLQREVDRQTAQQKQESVFGMMECSSSSSSSSGGGGVEGKGNGSDSENENCSNAGNVTSTTSGSGSSRSSKDKDLLSQVTRDVLILGI